MISWTRRDTRQSSDAALEGDFVRFSAKKLSTRDWWSRTCFRSTVTDDFRLDRLHFPAYAPRPDNSAADRPQRRRRFSADRYFLRRQANVASEFWHFPGRLPTAVQTAPRFFANSRPYSEYVRSSAWDLGDGFSVVSYLRCNHARGWNCASNLGQHFAFDNTLHCRAVIPCLKLF